jgi:hypothetical protein
MDKRHNGDAKPTLQLNPNAGSTLPRVCHVFSFSRKKGFRRYDENPLKQVPRTGLEPARPLRTLGPEATGDQHKHNLVAT